MHVWSFHVAHLEEAVYKGTWCREGLEGNLIKNKVYNHIRKDLRINISILA